MPNRSKPISLWYNKINLQQALKRLFGLALFVYLLFVVNITSVFDILISANSFFILCAMVVALIVIILRGMRWTILVRASNTMCSLVSCIRAYFISNFFAMVTPGRIGELGKPFYLGIKEPLTIARVLGTVIVDRLWDISVIFILGMISTLILGIRFEVDFHILFVVITVSIFALIFAIIALRGALLFRIMEKLKAAVGISELNFGSTFRDTCKLFLRTAPPALFLTLLGWIAHIIMAHYLALAIGLTISSALLIFSVAASTLVSLLPISFGGVGTRDGVFIVVFTQLGYSPEIALTFSFGFLFINFFLAFIGWLFQLFNLKYSA